SFPAIQFGESVHSSLFTFFPWPNGVERKRRESTEQMERNGKDGRTVVRKRMRHKSTRRSVKEERKRSASAHCGPLCEPSCSFVEKFLFSNSIVLSSYLSSDV